MLRPLSVRVFLDSLPFVFQREQSEGLNATYHFTFTGNEQREATVIIADKKIEVYNGHIGKADIGVTADSQTWLGFLARDKNQGWSLLSQKINIKGSPLTKPTCRVWKILRYSDFLLCVQKDFRSLPVS